MIKKIKAEEYSKWDKNLAKELTPLEALHSFDHWIQVEFANQFKIIETALKKIVVLSNQLEHERKIRIKQERKLKALEIINEKKVDVHIFLISVNCKHYNFMIDNRDRYLTQEEFDLLKEVLK